MIRSKSKHVSPRLRFFSRINERVCVWAVDACVRTCGHICLCVATSVSTKHSLLSCKWSFSVSFSFFFPLWLMGNISQEFEITDRIRHGSLPQTEDVYFHSVIA